MRFLRQYRFILLFFALLVFCSVMVLKQMSAKQSKHIELREAFILLHTRGETDAAERLYRKLLVSLPKLSQKELLDDFQRTLLLIDPDPNTHQTNNLIWKYHWTVSNEMNRQDESTLKRARALAGEE
jgi:gamma-glutamylcysteine synthetase